MSSDREQQFEATPADQFTRDDLDALILGLRVGDLPAHTFEQTRHLLVWNHDRDAWRVRAQQAEAMVCSMQRQLAAVRGYTQMAARAAAPDWHDMEASRG